MGREDIEKIKDHFDIVAVVSEHVTLKKRGRGSWGLCPFHQEKTPSFQVDPIKQMYKCFGCAKSGDVISFIMEIKGLSFLEAAKELADKAGLPFKLEKKEPEKSSEKKAYYEINRITTEFYQKTLFSAAGSEAFRYLKQRGIKEETIKEFSLGYAPDSWDSLVNVLKKKGATMEVAAKGGLVAEGKGNFYDRFRGRIMFPIIDLGSEIIGFGGRIIREKNNEPKYINTPETLVFAKRKVLYNLNAAKNHIRNDSATIVEGYMDVIALSNAGVRNAVATLGTALTEDHIRLLRRFTEKIKLVFDGDKAGKSAMVRAIEPFLKTDVIPEVVILPPNKDPDDIASSDIELWHEIISRSESMWDFIFRESFSNRNTSKLENKRIIVKELAPLIASVEETLIKDLLIERLSVQIGVEPSLVREHVNSLKTPQAPSPGKEIDEREKDLLEELLVRLMLYDAKIIKLIQLLDLSREFKDSHLAPLVHYMLEKGNTPLNDSSCPDKLRITASSYLVQGEISGDKEKALIDVVSRLMARAIDRNIEDIQGNIFKAEEKKEKKHIVDLLKTKQERLLAKKNIHNTIMEALQKL